jgi:hypothetical protein
MKNFKSNLREFASPISEFRKTAYESEAEFLERLRGVGMQEKARMDNARQRLHNESYAYPAAAIGAGAGVGAGALTTLPYIKKLPKGARGAGIPLAVGMGLSGGLIGALGGVEIGGRIRKNKDKNLSANLKPALRELAARSEAITEFAMVRDANGQYVEVEDEGGMGMGTVKAGAGAAALGGAGYGAYRADKAMMGSKFATGVPVKGAAGFGDMNVPIAQRLANAKAAKANFAGMGAFGQRKAVYGAAGKGLLSKVAGLAKFLR